MRLTLEKDKISNREEIIRQLTDSGYERVSIVVDRGEYAVRGGIIDIYPLNQSDAIRIEFFGNLIESIRVFEISSQRSIRHLDSTVVTDEKSFASMVMEDDPESLAESDIEEIENDDYVVHEQYGIAVFRGMRRVKTHSIEGEFYLLEYRDKEELYIPVLQSHMIHKYIGGDGVVPLLSSLSRKTWTRDTAKAQKSIKNIAMDLFKVYQERMRKQGHSFSGDEELLIELEKSFPYEETPDQLSAWLNTSKDMSSNHPMDRLICGDVGFGKTEVALRASFKAVLDNKQVAILVPTTVLARQHFLNFSERLKDFSVEVAMLSRFHTPAQNRDIIKRVKNGEIDIVIGTHRLIQKDVAFHDLGLLIIDEEQRFGVEHKEKIKNLHPLVDVLLLSATPIPRTLYLSLSGARNIDVINTPPRGRKPIKTYVAEYDENTVTKAISDELDSGGQVFFLNNDIKTLPTIQHHLQRLLPDVRIGLAHGRMSKNRMEEVLVKFFERELDILLCTTIIENGVDIPSVNTIIINNADHFGLSQLHQIRGRVGRSLKQAYAYLFYQKNKVLTEEGRKRLHALKEYVALGAGYQSSILGREQSGHIISIGFTLFMKLLESELSELKGEERPTRRPSFPLDQENFIPDDYLLEDELRVSFYQKLFACSKLDQLKQVEQEMTDRFGQLPAATINLIKNLMKGIK